MTNLTPSLHNITNQAKQGVRQAAPWIETLARLGYAAKGIVFLVIGVLAVETVFSVGGRTTDNQGALRVIAHEPFGQFLLGLMTLGLAGYALWRFIEAFLDPENEGSDAKGLGKRLGYFISGVAYAGIAYGAYRLLEGASGSSSTHNTRDWTARLLSEPFGQWLVGLLGLIVIGIGIAQLVQAYKADFDKRLDLGGLSQSARHWILIF